MLMSFSQARSREARRGRSGVSSRARKKQDKFRDSRGIAVLSFKSLAKLSFVCI